jgi:flagellar hook-length control protein FliK
MPIIIVSALPKPASSPTANAAAGMEGADPAQDFTSLLLGQLTAARQDVELTPGTASESAAANDSVGGNPDNENAGSGDPLVLLAAMMQASLEQRDEADDENAESGDPLALLAALTHASLEQRDEITSEDAMENKSSSATGLSAQASRADENSLLADRMTRNAAHALSADRLQTPANEPAANEPAANFAAKLAISPDNLSSEKLSNPQESAGLSTINTLTAAPARQNDASPAIPVPTSVYDRNWNNDFAQKVTWIATHNKQSAELTLNPPSMGSIEISLKLDSSKSTATAFFVSSNAEVRETIETSLPRLREMLAGAGIQLGQTHVGAESFRQASGNGQPTGQGASPSWNDMDILASDPQEARSAVSLIGAGRGLIDMFA